MLRGVCKLWEPFGSSSASNMFVIALRLNGNRPIAPYDPNAAKQRSRLGQPAHWFGTIGFVPLACHMSSSSLSILIAPGSSGESGLRLLASKLIVS